MCGVLCGVDACHVFSERVQQVLQCPPLRPVHITEDFMDAALRGSCGVHFVYLLDLAAVRHHLVIERKGGLAYLHQTFVKDTPTIAGRLGRPTGYTAQEWGGRTPPPGTSAQFRAAHAAWAGELGPAQLRKLFSLILRLQAAADVVTADLVQAHPLAQEEAAWVAAWARRGALRKPGAASTEVASPISLWARDVCLDPAFPANVSADHAELPSVLASNARAQGKPWALRLPASYAALARLFAELTGEALPIYTPLSLLTALHWRSTGELPDPARHATDHVPSGWSIMSTFVKD